MWVFDLSSKEATKLLGYKSLKSLRALRETQLVRGYHFVFLGSRTIRYSREKLSEFITYGNSSSYSKIVEANLEKRDRLFLKK